MPLIASGPSVGIPPGSAPTWDSSPTPIFFIDTAVNYDLSQDVSGATSYALNGGSTALPTGVTLSAENLVYDGAGSAATTTGIIIDATNGDGTTASSSFSIVINAAPAAQTFPLFDWYKAIVEYRGGTIIPLSNARFWDKPVYETSFTSTETTRAAFETAVNAASAGDSIALQDGTHTGNITITVSGTANNPISLVSQTLGGCDMSGATIRIDGSFINVQGFKDVRYDINGADIVVSYTQRDATEFNDFTSDGARNRFCYNTCTGKTENDQYWNIVGAGIKPDNRIDHNHYLRHKGSDSPSGASEHGQVGQNQIELNYFMYYDNNYCFEHLNDGAGNKTVSNESELMSLKSSRNMVVQNVFKHCNSHVSVREGRECTIYANWFIGGGTSTERPGGIVAGGRDNLLACNYYFELNNGNVNGEACVDVNGGIVDGREAGDDTEVAFNTAWDCRKIFDINRSNHALKPTDVQIHSNAFKELNSGQNVVWANNSTTPNFGANVFGPDKGIGDADVVEAIPGLSLSSGYRAVTNAGNCDGTSDNISVMGPIIKELLAQGVLVDILGNDIPSTGADLGCIQTGEDLTTDPVTAIINAAGHGA